jgi:hypothetical protein
MRNSTNCTTLKRQQIKNILRVAGSYMKHYVVVGNAFCALWKISSRAKEIHDEEDR